MTYNYSELLRLIQNQEFDNIKVIGVENLEIEEIEKEGMVKEMTIDGNPSFNKNDRIPFNSEIVIYYHLLRKINVPMSAKKARGKDKEEIVALFKRAGFVYVYLLPIYDLKIGVLKKDGTVERVCVGNNTDFKPDSLFRIDTKVEITYHTYIKNRKL